MSTLLRYMVVWWISVVSSIRPIVLLYSKMFIIYYIISIFGIRFLSNICYSFQSNTHYLQIFGIRINRILESILYSVQSNIWYSIGECQSKIEYFWIPNIIEYWGEALDIPISDSILPSDRPGPGRISYPRPRLKFTENLPRNDCNIRHF